MVAPEKINFEAYNMRRSKKNGKLVAICNACNKSVANTSQLRLKSHYENCTETNEDDENENSEKGVPVSNSPEVEACSPMAQVQPSNSIESTPKSLEMPTSGSIIKETPVACSRKRPHWLHQSCFADKCNDKQAEDIKISLVHFLVQSGINFECVEKPAFRTFIKNIRPAFKKYTEKITGKDLMSYVDILYEQLLESKANSLRENVCLKLKYNGYICYAFAEENCFVGCFYYDDDEEKGGLMKKAVSKTFFLFQILLIR